VTEVFIRDCRTARLQVQCPNLQHLEVESLSATQLNIIPGKLRTLRLLQCSKMSEGGIRACLVRLTGLRELDVSGNLPITDDTLREVRFCP
jgi:hypothetical protein